MRSRGRKGCPMLCCAALIFVMGLVREAWFRLPGTTRPEEPGFAPRAYRPAPGEPQPRTIAPTSPAIRTPNSRPRVPRTSGRAPRLRLVSMGFAVGSAIYILSLQLLFALDAAQRLTDGTIGWGTRTVVFVMIAVAAAWIGRHWKSAHAGDLIVSALAGSGIAWWILSYVDMHMLMLIDIAHGSLAWDLVFHGVGVVLTGAALIWSASSTPARRSQPAPPEGSPRGVSRDQLV
ncbi:hypothetical protein [Hoyosella altamirensis]|uniref:hypothetical protein n=1 Tax=Hoyosella altamirensis TaxID=616997 RepID=UPI0012EE4298|nr:hypothetical protein [Hoyosella altamirensis]